MEAPKVKVTMRQDVNVLNHLAGHFKYTLLHIQRSSWFVILYEAAYADIQGRSNSCRTWRDT